MVSIKSPTQSFLTFQANARCERQLEALFVSFLSLLLLTRSQRYLPLLIPTQEVDKMTNRTACVNLGLTRDVILKTNYKINKLERIWFAALLNGAVCKISTNSCQLATLQNRVCVLDCKTKLTLRRQREPREHVSECQSYVKNSDPR